MLGLKHAIAIVFSLAIFFLVLVVLEWVDENRVKVVPVSNHRALMPVSVINVVPASHQVFVQSYGEIRPRWRTQLKARVSGEVLFLSANLQTGKHIKKADVLLSIDDKHYQTQFAESQNQVAQAELILHKEQQEALMAKRERVLSGSKAKPSTLAMHEPHIKAAKAQLAVAKAHLKEVKQMAFHAQVKAPYDGVVVSRSVSPGEIVETGQVLAEVMSAKLLQMTLKLDETQWNLLGMHWQGKTASVYRADDITSAEKWSAIMQRDGGFIDSKTRQHLLHLSLDPDKNILSGTFVRVVLPGKTVPRALKIPSSALSADGFVWYVDKHNKLYRFRANRLFSRYTRSSDHGYYADGHAKLPPVNTRQCTHAGTKCTADQSQIYAKISTGNSTYSTHYDGHHWLIQRANVC